MKKTFSIKLRTVLDNHLMHEQLQEVITGARLLAIPDRAILEFTGEDRHRYLNGQTTNNILDLPPHHARHAAICNTKGKMQGEGLFSHFGDRIRLDYPAVLADSLPARLGRYIISDDVEMIELPAPALLFHTLGDHPPVMDSGWTVVASTRFGRPGWDCWQADSVNPPCLPVADIAVTEWWRIQNGIPAWGTDIDESTLPPEAFAEGTTIRYDKGCYVGQEVIARIKSIGRVNKKLCLLKCSQNSAPVSPASPTDDATPPIRLTSIQSSPDPSGTIRALAMLPRSIFENDAGAVINLNDVAWSLERCCC